MVNYDGPLAAGEARNYDCVRVQFANGDTYFGGYADDLKSGLGVYTFAAGSAYVGEYAEGKRHGRCVLGARGACWQALSHALGVSHALGTATANLLLLQGHGEMVMVMVMRMVASNLHLLCLLHHRGIMIMPDKGLYSGELAKDRFEGQGEYRYPDGSVYAGSWLAGKKDGWVAGSGCKGGFKDQGG